MIALVKDATITGLQRNYLMLVQGVNQLHGINQRRIKMINEKKLKSLLNSIIIWTELSSKPDVKKLVKKELDEAIILKEKDNKQNGKE